MKTRIIGAIIGLILPFLSYGQLTWFEQYFDGDTSTQVGILNINIDTSSSNVWQIGRPQKSIFNSASTLPNALITDTVNFYPTNDTSSFLFGINRIWNNFGIVAIQWKQKLDMEKGHDGGIIEYSSDTGKTWTNVIHDPNVYNFFGFNYNNIDTLGSGEYAFSGLDSTWKDIWLCVDPNWLFAFSDTLLVRFTLKSDSIEHNREGWIIDNMLVHVTFAHTINEEDREQYMTVSPNPTTGRVNISTKKIEEYHVIEKMELVNMEGKVVQQWGLSPTKYFIEIDHHPDGIYFLYVKTNKGQEKFKIILEH